MKLKAFQVKEFRSVTNSTAIRVEDGRTVLVGRNESGKSSLLKALFSIRPASSPLPTWGHARDFPRARKRSEFSTDLAMLETTWELEPSERDHLQRQYPRATGVTDVAISRTYAPRRIVALAPKLSLRDIAKPAIDGAATIAAEISGAAQGAPGADAIDAALAFTAVINRPVEAPTWGTAVVQAIGPLRAALAAATLANTAETALSLAERAANAVANDDAQRAAATAWVEERIPPFIYLDDWDFVPGHYNVREYLQRASENKLTGADALFQKLLKVAELNAKELHDLLETQHEERKLLTDRASNIVTDTIQGLWKDRQITVQFSLDGDHFDIIVKDKDSNALVPLDERSRGFRWYFSFFITFAADTQGGHMDNAILLLDEPGLYLHARAQEALLLFFAKLPNQIIYTTHSPFMVEPSELASVRTVNLDRPSGTTVSGEPTGDENTLFPLQAALGYNLTQTLFVGSDNVVIEGVTDYWYLTTASEALKESGAGLADGLVLTPAGGAGKVGYMVALLSAQALNVAVLLDSDAAGTSAVRELLTSKLIRDASIVRVGDAVPGAAEADVEDLLESSVFDELVHEAYKKELKGKALVLNEHVPRIVVRYEQAFAALGMEFHKTRVAKLFLMKMGGKDAATVFPSTTADRFRSLFAKINAAVALVKSHPRRPFAN